MQQYEALTFLQLHAGKVEIEEAQYLRQAHQLEATAHKGVFEITGHAGFKAGETFGYDGEIPKTLADAVKSSEPKPAPKPAPAAKKKATKKTAAGK